jgi:transposase
MRYCHSFGSPVRFEAPTTTDTPAAPSAAKSPVVSVVVRTSYDGLAWAETDSATGKKKTVVVDPQTGNKLVIDE